MNKIDLSQHDLDVVIKILRTHLPVTDYDIYFFGSRVNGTSTEKSDLDVLIKGKKLAPLEKIALINEAMENSNLTFKVDVLDFHACDPVIAKRLLQEAVIPPLKF
jgi:predicted nucleotidyltransferase